MHEPFIQEVNILKLKLYINSFQEEPLHLHICCFVRIEANRMFGVGVTWSKVSLIR